MNKVFTLLLFSAFFQVSFAQSDKFQNMDAIGIKMSDITYDKLLPFRNIEIIDSRQDTSKVGFVIKNGRFKKAVVIGGLQKTLTHSLNNYLRSNLDSSKKESLLIVIKKLWLNEFYSCESKLEIYLKTSEYYIPLIRFEIKKTIENNLNKKDGSTIATIFQECLFKLENVDFNKAISSNKKLKREEILTYNKNTFQFPILEDIARQRGVFLTFQDFLQNKVSKLEFQIEFGKLTDELYVINGNEKSLLTDLWGFCDGEKLFIKSGYNYYELHPQQNTFEFLGSIDRPTLGMSSGPSRGSNYKEAIAGGLLYELSKYPPPKKDLKPCQINMETGKPY